LKEKKEASPSGLKEYGRGRKVGLSELLEEKEFIFPQTLSQVSLYQREGFLLPSRDGFLLPSDGVSGFSPSEGGISPSLHPSL